MRFSASATDFYAWGLSGTTGPISTGTWHRIQLSLEPTVVYAKRPRTSVGILVVGAGVSSS